MYQLRISGVSVLSHFRVPDTSVSDTYQECVLYVSVVSVTWVPPTLTDTLYQDVSGVYQACIRSVSGGGVFYTLIHF